MNKDELKTEALKYIKRTLGKEMLAKSDWMSAALAYCDNEHLAELFADFALERAASTDTPPQPKQSTHNFRSKQSAPDICSICGESLYWHPYEQVKPVAATPGKPQLGTCDAHHRDSPPWNTDPHERQPHCIDWQPVAVVPEKEKGE